MPKISRARSEFQLVRGDVMDSKEVHDLLQELSYHADMSHKQLQELCERVQSAREASDEFQQPDEARPELSSVLSEFGLPTEPLALRAVLAARARPRARSEEEMQQSSTPSTPSCGPAAPKMSPSGLKLNKHSPVQRQRTGGFQSRMAVRLQITHFLQEARNRIRVITLWRNEASLLQVLHSCNSILCGPSGDKWFGRIYVACETMLSNFLDENDSPIREVIFDLVSREAKRSLWRPPADDCNARPPQVESVRRVVLCFADAVLSVRARAEPGSRNEVFERSQWADCLSRVCAQFEQALQETWHRIWPGVQLVSGPDTLEESPMESLQRTLEVTSENALLLGAATKAIVASASELENVSQRDPEQFWGAFLRQAITVSKSFLKLAREMTVLTGLGTASHVQAGEELSQTVLRQEYRRVRKAFADLLIRRSRDILDDWSMRIMKEVPGFARYLEAHRDRHIDKRTLNAVIEWWRTGHSGMLRTVCMDIVSFHFSPQADTESCGAEDTRVELQLEEVLAILPIFEDIVLETLRRELAVRSGLDLSAVDEPRVRDILARLTHELSRHLDSEWHIAHSVQRAAKLVLPRPELFQMPNWGPPAPFDFGASKTAFLGTEIIGRYVVTRYVSRGAMGRVWVVEDQLNPEEFPLCLKTFYCECECEEMSNLSMREFKRSILEELSQVERWMTSRTRLAVSRHLVRVVRVFRDAPVVRLRGGARVEGTISGILMEFCDKGELTSYLWDEKRQTPRAFPEETAQFLFAQLGELLVELFAPPILGNVVEGSFTAFETDDASHGFMLKEGAVMGNSDRTTSVGAFMPSTRTTSLAGSCASFAELVDLPIVDRAETMEDEFPCMLRRKSRKDSWPDRPRPLKYFHNDIKAENLVLSGTTLKLIDFQSLTPLRTTRGAVQPQVEHATPAYQHRRTTALGESLEARAEGTAIWACGVILVRLLASQLGSDWVYEHRGLGSQEDVERLLPEGHCLRSQHPGGPRDLLERIFSAESTASIMEVVTHPWVREARERWQGSNSEAAATVRRALEELRPQGADPRSALLAWIPLTGCVCICGQLAPLRVVEDIINTAISLSDGRFRHDGCRQRTRRRPLGEDGETVEQSFHEWHIIVCADDDGESSTPDEELFATTSKDTTPMAETTTSRVTALSLLSGIVGFDTKLPDPRSVAVSTTSVPASPSRESRRHMFHSLRTRLVVDRFYVQVRTRDDVGEDEPDDIWWLRVKWLPPMVAGKKHTLGGFTAGGHGWPGAERRHVECSSFVQLQQLLLEGRNEVAQRADRSHAQERRSVNPGQPMLPIFGR